MLKKLRNTLYKVSRNTGRSASYITDFNNIKQGRVDKVMKKRVRRSAHRSLNKFFRKRN